MKPVAFDYERPRTIAEARAAAAGNPDAKILAGGQTLGPMLNLRLVQPALIVDITRIAELARVEEDGRRRHPRRLRHPRGDRGQAHHRPVERLSRRVARGIAYRAVRTRGTIGGSLAHADPAADWLSCLTALGAEVLLTGAAGSAPRRARRFRARRHGDGARAGRDSGRRSHPEALATAPAPAFPRFAARPASSPMRSAPSCTIADRGVLRLVAGATQGRADRDRCGSVRRRHELRRPLEPLREKLAAIGARRDAYALNIHLAAIQRAVDEGARVMTAITLTVNGQAGQRRGHAAHASGRFPARAPAADRHAYRLRARHLRRLHRRDRRRDRPLLHHLCGGLRRRRGAHHRRLRRRRADGAAAPGVQRGACASMRLLHARHADRGARSHPRERAA